MSQPFLSQPDDAPAYWNRAALWMVRLAADQTEGSFTLLEQLMPRATARRFTSTSGPPRGST